MVRFTSGFPHPTHAFGTTQFNASFSACLVCISGSNLAVLSLAAVSSIHACRQHFPSHTSSHLAGAVHPHHQQVGFHTVLCLSSQRLITHSSTSSFMTHLHHSTPRAFHRLHPHTHGAAQACSHTSHTGAHGCLSPSHSRVSPQHTHIIGSCTHFSQHCWVSFGKVGIHPAHAFFTTHIPGCTSFILSQHTQRPPRRPKPQPQGQSGTRPHFPGHRIRHHMRQRGIMIRSKFTAPTNWVSPDGHFLDAKGTPFSPSAISNFGHEGPTNLY